MILHICSEYWGGRVEVWGVLTRFFLRTMRLYRRRALPCPAVKQSEEWGDPSKCEGAEACQYCHTRTEQQFHPEVGLHQRHTWFRLLLGPTSRESLWTDRQLFLPLEDERCVAGRRALPPQQLTSQRLLCRSINPPSATTCSRAAAAPADPSVPSPTPTVSAAVCRFSRPPFFSASPRLRSRPPQSPSFPRSPLSPDPLPPPDPRTPSRARRPVRVPAVARTPSPRRPRPAPRRRACWEVSCPCARTPAAGRSLCVRGLERGGTAGPLDSSGKIM